MIRRLGTVVAAAVLTTIAVAAPAQAASTVTVLKGLTPKSFNIANAINDAGTAVGRSGTQGHVRAVKWNPDGAITDLGGPADLEYLEATAINNAGVIVGIGERTLGDPARVIRYDLDGTYRILGQMTGYSHVYSMGVDDEGLVYGEAWESSNGKRRALRWDLNGVPAALTVPAGYTQTSLGGASGNGFAVGNAFNLVAQSDNRAVRWNPDGTITLLPLPSGTKRSIARSVNRHGAVTGFVEPVTGHSRAVRWNPDGTITDLGASVQVQSDGSAINDSGVVLGTVQDADIGFRPVRWSATGEMTELPVVDGGWEYQPSGINSDGVMVGHDGSWPDEWAYRWTP